MADVQNLKTFEKVLKENYLPVWNNMLNIEPTPFLAKIKKKTLKSNKIVAAADIGLAGGFGFGEEGMNTPQAGRVRFERFETTAKDMYVDIGISAKAVRLTGSAGAMADALDTEIKGAYAAAKWNVGRSYFGNGSGVLCKVRDATTYSNGVITAYVNDVKMLKEGLTVDLYVKGGTTPDSNGTALRIKSIEHTTTTFTPTGEGAAAEKVYKITLDGASASQRRQSQAARSRAADLSPFRTLITAKSQAWAQSLTITSQRFTAWTKHRILTFIRPLSAVTRAA